MMTVEYLKINHEQRELKARGLESQVEILELNKIPLLDVICYYIDVYMSDFDIRELKKTLDKTVLVEVVSKELKTK